MGFQVSYIWMGHQSFIIYSMGIGATCIVLWIYGNDLRAEDVEGIHEWGCFFKLQRHLTTVLNFTSSNPPPPHVCMLLLARYTVSLCLNSPPPPCVYAITSKVYSLCLNFFHLLARKPNLEIFSIYSNKFFHNFHLPQSSFTSPGFRQAV